jgi:hypothetical protein
VAVAFVGARGAMRHDHRFTPWIGNHHILHHKYPRFNFGEFWIDACFGTQCPYVDDYEYGLFYTCLLYFIEHGHKCWVTARPTRWL